jgi:chromosome segregation ATPase
MKAIGIVVLALTLAFARSQECRYEFVVPEGNGVSCSSPEMGRMHSDLQVARERANSVASTLSSEITKMETMAKGVEEEMKTMSQELAQIKTDVGKMDTENQNFEKMELAIHHMNETLARDFKFLSKKLMDATSSLQTQLTRQVDIISALATEESSQRKVLDMQTIRLNEVSDVPQSVKRIENEVNSVRNNLERTSQEMNDTKHDLQGVKSTVQKSEDRVNSQISSMNTKIDKLQSLLMGVNLKALQNDIVSLNQRTNSLGTTLRNHSKLLENFDPTRLHNQLAAMEEELASEREKLNEVMNKTASSSPAVISQKLDALTSSVNDDRATSKNMWDGLWSRVHGVSKMMDDLSRTVAEMKSTP